MKLISADNATASANWLKTLNLPDDLARSRAQIVDMLLGLDDAPEPEKAEAEEADEPDIHLAKEGTD